MYKFDIRYEINKEITFEGKIVSFLKENGYRTAIIKVLSGAEYPGFTEESIIALKFKSGVQDSIREMDQEYETSFIDQLTDKYGFDGTFDKLLGKKFNFTYTGTKIETSSNFYIFEFKSVEPLNDISIRFFRDNKTNDFIQYEGRIDEVYMTKKGCGLLIKKNTDSIKDLHPANLYEFYWIPADKYAFVQNISLVFECLEGSEEYGGVEELKAMTFLVKERNYYSAITRGENYDQFVEFSNVLEALEFDI